MNCLDFRRQIGAEPASHDVAVVQHRAECATCAAYQDELLAMDVLLARAMRISLRPPESGAKTRPAPRSTVPPRRWLALAASLVIGILVAATLWVSYPAPTLASEVIGHVSHEPGAWNARDPLGADAIGAVLAPSGIRLRDGAVEVTFAKRCFFERHWVPHLVVQTVNGPVTVLLLAHRQVESLAHIDGQDFTGVVLPAPRGSIAIVGRNVSGLDDIARQVFEAVEWDV